MGIQLNHTIVPARDARASATWLCEILGRDAPTSFGPFWAVTLDNSATLDFQHSDATLPVEHYAFLVSEAEFDKVYAVNVKSGESEYRVVALRLSDGTIVVNGIRMTGVKHAIGKLLIAESAVGVVLLGLLAAGSLTAARRRLSPLEDMVETASAIAEGDLSRRIGTARHGSSEVEQLSSSLNAMLQQIETGLTESERATAQLRQFLADASHELRTPLASVRGYLQLYEKGMLDAEEKDRALTRVSAEALRMSRLVDELLALARLEDPPPLTLRPVDLCCLVRDAAADLAAQQPERPMTLLLPDLGDPLLPCAEGDEAGLRQVVGNLLANVRVHTPASSPVTIEVTARTGAGAAAGSAPTATGTAAWTATKPAAGTNTATKPAAGTGTATPTGTAPAGPGTGTGTELRLRITDTGPGLAPEDAARAFDRFFRADPDRARDTGGAGLGMSIVQAVVHAHHGTVTLDTTPGQGLTVEVTLPAAKSKSLAPARV